MTTEPMKNSGMEWVSDMPAGWQYMRVKYLIKGISDGTHGTFERTEEGRPLLSAKNIFNDHLLITDNESLVSESDHCSIVSSGYPKVGDVLISCVGTIGRTCVYDLEYPTSFQRSVVFLRPNDLISSRMLMYCLMSDSTLVQEKLRIKQSAQPGIYQGDILELVLPIPPASHHNPIVKFLDTEVYKIDQALNLLHQELEMLEQLKTSIIFEAVTKGLDPTVPMKDSGIEWIEEVPTGWQYKPLKSAVSFIKGLSILKTDLTDEGVPVLSYGQIHAKNNTGVTLHNDMLRYVPRELTIYGKASRLRFGDLVFADTSEDLEGSGKVAFIDTNEEVFAGYHTIICRVHDRSIYPKFLGYVANSTYWRDQVRQQVSGVKVFSVTQSILRSTTVLLPTYSEQRLITAVLDEKTGKIDQVISIKTKQLETLEELKNP